MNTSLDQNISGNIEAITKAIGIPEFNRIELLEIVLIHSSHNNENPDLTPQQRKQREIEYRRLALLGDAILGAVVTDYLYHYYPLLDPDALSKMKSNFLVTKKKLSEFALDLNLRQLCLLGGSGSEIDKNESNRFLSETFEALLGAVYLEFKRDFSRIHDWFVEHFLADAVNNIFKATDFSSVVAIENKENLSLKNERERRLSILGNDLLCAIVIDYLYHRFKDQSQGQLTQWKSSLMERNNCIPKFKATLGEHYIALNRDFSATSDWLIEDFIAVSVDKLLADYRTREEQEVTVDGFIDGSASKALFKLVNHITDKDKRDVFLQFADTSNPADELLLLMKQKVDELAAADETLEQLLAWIQRKSSLVSFCGKPAVLRAFYFALVRVFYFDFAAAFACSTRGRSLARSFAKSIERARSLMIDPDVKLMHSLSFGFYPAGVIAFLLTQDFEPELSQALQQFMSEIPHPDRQKEKFDQWRKTEGQVWLMKFSTLIALDFKFNEEDKEHIKRYYYTHNLLVDCLNSASHVTEVARQEIEANLLLLQS